MLMRVACGIHGKNWEKAIETYNLMSERYFTHASPTVRLPPLFHYESFLSLTLTCYPSALLSSLTLVPQARSCRRASSSRCRTTRLKEFTTRSRRAPSSPRRPEESVSTSTTSEPRDRTLLEPTVSQTVSFPCSEPTTPLLDTSTREETSDLEPLRTSPSHRLVACCQN